MKASEFLRLAVAFERDYVYSDIMSEVRFGCDCGCGGDSYTSEDWDEMIEAAEDAYNAFHDYCLANNIKWDYDDF